MASAFMPESDSEDELPPGWEERATLEGQVYYANRDTQSTQWQHPRTKCRKTVPGKLPFGWKREVLPDGKVLYVNHETQRTTFSDPRLAFAVEDRGPSTPGANTGLNTRHFRQRFDASTTADQILHGTDLTDKVAVVTGGGGGIGFQVARSLACHGARVVIAARDVRAAEVAAAEIRRERRHFRLRVDVLHLDLSSLQSVVDFAQTFQDLFTSDSASGMSSEKPRLDILVLNAGVMGLDFQRTTDGLETMFQVNYLSQFLLTLKLLPVIRGTRGSDRPRVVYVSSESHRFTGDEDPINKPMLTSEGSEEFVSTYAYNRSKLYGLMFMMEASTKWPDISCLAVHPGNMVSSNLGRNWWIYRLISALVRPFVKSLKQAAGTVVFAAASSDLSNATGIYINNCFPCNPHQVVADPKFRRRIWRESVELISSRLPSAFSHNITACESLSF